MRKRGGRALRESAGRLKELYLEAFPDGRERQQSQPGNNYIRVRPTRVRYSDFNVDPPETIEFNRAGLGLR